MEEKKLTLLESVDLLGEGADIPDLSPEDLIIKPLGVANYVLVDAIESGNHWRDRFNAQCAEIVEKHKDVLDFDEEDRAEGNKPAIAEEPVKIESGKLSESLLASPALKIDEITPFFEMCDRLGIETLGDFERFMKEYGKDKDPIAALKDYFTTELEDLDFRAKKESLTESVSDGWPESLSDYDFFQDVDRLAYEIRHAYRGAYSGATTYEELADFLEGTIQSELDEVIEYLRNEAEDVEPLEDEDESLDESLTEDSEGGDKSSEDSAGGDQELTPVVKVDLSKFRPWGNAVKSYREIEEAGKLYDLEKMLTQEWPDGIADVELNDLLTDTDFLSAALDMKFSEEGDE